MILVLREYQEKAVDELICRNRGICVAPAGSGKTIIAANLISRCDRERFQNVTWIAHTQEQVDQGKKALQSCGISDVTVCCYASMPDTTHTDLLIVDECHWAGAPSVRQLIDQCNGNVYGFTATPIREDGIDITEIIGEIAYVVGRHEIQSVKGVLPAEVVVVENGMRNEYDMQVEILADRFYNSKLKWLDTKNGSDEQWQRCVYRAALDIGIRNNHARDGKIAAIAKRHKDDSVIILVDSKEHGKRLQSMISGSALVHAGAKGRQKSISDFRAGLLKCIICTSLMDEGADVPIANVLILAGAGKAFGKIIQRTGRVLRPHHGKDRGIIYDIHDRGHGMLSSQHYKRVKVYRQAGYTVRGDYAV